MAGLGVWLRRLFGGQEESDPSPDERQRLSPLDEQRPSTRCRTAREVRKPLFEKLGRSSGESDRSEIEAWLRRLAPPSDLHDRGAWDTYWKNQLDEGLMEQGLSDLMAADHELPDLLSRRGVRTILCVGNGMSIEALELALLGFDVTAFDLSGVTEGVYGRMVRDPEHPLSRIPGFRVTAGGTVTFGAPGTIDSALFNLPHMHRRADQPFQGGGSLTFVTGDLTDPSLCPGPFDAVIERRTVQLFQGAEQAEALERLVQRLGARGLFVSHEHSGRWKPTEPRTHFAEAWLRKRGFDTSRSVHADRSAILVFTSG